jgi:hypothetical protein
MQHSMSFPFWRRFARPGLAFTGSVAVVTVAAVAPAVAGAALHFGGGMQDLAPTTPGPFDSARATLQLVDHAGSATAVLTLKGVDPAAAGQTFGAHLHSGPCVAGNGAAAGPHYNHSGTVPPVVDDSTEVWLDVTVTRGGTAHAVSHVDWFPSAGTRSVVVHERPTATDGTAGARLACLPVEW